MVARTRIITVVVALLATAACSDDKSDKGRSRKTTDVAPTPPKPVADNDLFGPWRAVLASPGGDLPFGLRFIKRVDGTVVGTITNGKERITEIPVTLDGSKLVISFPHYDSAINAVIDQPGWMSGEWVKTIPGGETRMAFSARKGVMYRFEPTPKKKGVGPNSINGPWRIVLTDADGETVTRAELIQRPMHLSGTILTPTGDYRYLRGVYNDSVARLSTFDGAHAFLFIIKLNADASMTGDFWSGDKYHATLTGKKIFRSNVVLPDPFAEVTVKSRDKRFRFSFPDHASGEVVTSKDERFKNKVLIVDIFGSWCPNCNDMAPVLVELKKRFGDKGLEVVGLAFEYTGDEKRDREIVGRFVKRHGINYPVLLAGVSDKAQATAALPDISEVKAYPTTLFVGRDGKVRRIHSGFVGPASEKRHKELLVEIMKTVADLLDEK